MKIIVDHREHEIISLIQSKQEAYDWLTVEVKALDLGDMEIYYDDQLLFIWERKTFSDLLNSLRDGRYAEQSARILQHYKPNQVIYGIEGIFSQLNPKDKQLVVSCMTSLAFTKGFHIWRTTQPHDTVEQLIMCCTKINRDYSSTTFSKMESAESGENENHLGYAKYVIKREKKENITRENIGIIFLKQIPTISNATAVALMDHVDGDFSKLIDLVNTDIQSLSQLMVGKRRIGKNIIQNLQTYLGRGRGRGIPSP